MTTITVTVGLGPGRTPMVLTGESEETILLASRLAHRHARLGGGASFEVSCDTDESVRITAYEKLVDYAGYCGRDDRPEFEVRLDEAHEQIEVLRTRETLLNQRIDALQAFQSEQQSRETAARAVLLDPQFIVLQPSMVPIVVREFFEACWPGHIMDRTLFSGPIEQGLPRLLEFVLQYGLVNGRCSITNLCNSLALYEKENANLRRTLAWLAWREEVTPEMRELLAQRIRTHAIAEEDMEVAQDTFEERAADYLKLQRKLDEVCDLVQLAIDAELPEAEPDTPADGGRTRRLPHGWTAKMDNLMDFFRARTIPLQPVTLAEIREL